ncbi:MAG: prepilin-type N-terminal cleavage/methylation domain-containing protein [Elusimicrobia bacterium]|nr:prepilin-type N-terminal cleavage/methylation domain-containing protein [Elusimicrobiota bacterium]
MKDAAIAGSRARRASPGFTLAEVMIAALIMAVGTSAMLSVTLSTRTQLIRTGIKDQMAQESRQLLQKLQFYVAQDGVAGSPQGGWSIPGDIVSGALTNGPHVATDLLPDHLKGAPHEATLEYFVTQEGDTKKIDITATWEGD